MARPDVDFLSQHRPFFLDENVIEFGPSIKKGMVLNFLYGGKQRWVFVVAPEWKGKLHGLDLKFVPRGEFLPIINAPEKWTPDQLYTARLQSNRFKRLFAYRTYDLPGITNTTRIIYDSSLTGTEQATRKTRQQEVDFENLL